MGLGVGGTVNATAELAAAGSYGPGLRMMQVAQQDPQYCNVTTPQDNFTVQIPWSHPVHTIPPTDGSDRRQMASPAIFSAVCYYTGLSKDITVPELISICSIIVVFVCMFVYASPFVSVYLTIYR